MLPSSKPKLKREDLIKLIPDTLDTSVPVLIGIRGYYEDTMGKAGQNDRGIYDDACFVLWKDGFESFNFNTDPSVDRKGIATLVPGIHKYRKGNHGISKPGGGYPAFRPATVGEKLPVKRDGQSGLSEGIAINIHKGSNTKTSSEGCQTVPPPQWESFRSLVYSLMDKYKITTINYLLIEWNG